MSQFSGKFVVRLPSALHRNLSETARQQGLSLNQVCLTLLQADASDKRGTDAPLWQREAEKILKQLKKKFGAGLLGLVAFGSQVRGEATKHSDLDLLIVLEEKFPIKRGIYEWWDSTVQWKGSIREISPHFVHLATSPERATGLWYEIAMFHKIIFEKGRKISGLIKELIQSVERGEISRSFSNGHPYWIKEEPCKTGP